MKQIPFGYCSLNAFYMYLLCLVSGLVAHRMIIMLVSKKLRQQQVVWR